MREEHRLSCNVFREIVSRQSTLLELVIGGYFSTWITPNRYTIGVGNDVIHLL